MSPIRFGRRWIAAPPPLLSLCNATRPDCRLFSTAATGGAATYPALVYSKYGRPEDILRVSRLQLPPLHSSSVNVQFLAAPINPADINVLQGTYPVKPAFKDYIGGAVAGNEGVARVVAVGREVQDLSVGDWVLPLASGSGTWRTHAQYTRDDLLRIDSEGASPITAATITVNPSTAYRMIRDFAVLKPGDVLLQNGANSGVGQAVVQLANAWGFRTVNIVRPRPNIDELKAELQALGADMVITEDEARRPEVAAAVKELGQGSSPTLALNCVGGKSATNMVRLLGHGGHVVTYGGMSREPLTLPTSAFIFKDLKAHGFWMTRWYNEHPTHERAQMLADLFKMAREGKLKEPWHRVWKFSVDGVNGDEGLQEMCKEAVSEAGKGLTSKKQIFIYE
ncbi:hypothetical protein HDU86_006245 [Geranomyces michiganensis]|nr:hypothetical protein HDU86_006245 [Geranomyces michiganensis]